MAGQADGSIIIDTELDPKGFEAGSKELLSAIQSLTQEIKNLGESLREMFSQSLTPEVNTSGAEDEAEARDLHIEYDRAIGYSITSSTETFTEKLKASGFDMTIRFARVTPAKKASSEREKPHKYICPCCGQEVRSTADLNLICGVCEVPMERAD